MRAFSFSPNTRFSFTTILLRPWQDGSIGDMARFTELLLTALQFQAKGLLTLGEILFSSEEAMRRFFHRIPTEERSWFKENWAGLYRDRQQFYCTLNHLKRQGLVAKQRGGSSGSRWALTPRGEERNYEYRQSRRDPLSSANTAFSKPQGAGITIVAYDIPEKERRKREWIRMCLIEMECEKIQQSVWVAKGTVDEDFIHALRERDLLRNVHIFAVTKHGTVGLAAM